MDKASSSILVTGGAGYIGSHTVVELLNAGYASVISVDDYRNSGEATYDRIADVCGKKPLYYETDLTDRDALRHVFERHPEISGVIHFAALKAVGESVEKPLLYYRNNLNALLNLLELSAEFGVKSFIFSSSCTVYGQPETFPVNENTPLSEPESPYGYTKLAGERIIRDLARNKPDMRFVLLRYFNPVGAHVSGLIGELQLKNPNNLVPYITMVAAGILPRLTIHGGDYPTRDGTCIRDYIHVSDIADAHIKALEYAVDRMPGENVDVFNLGSGRGVSVLEAVQAFEAASGQALNYVIGPRREGDVTAIYSDSSKATRILGWTPKHDLADMMASAWKWQLQVLSS